MHLKYGELYFVWPKPTTALAGRAAVRSGYPLVVPALGDFSAVL